MNVWPDGYLEMVAYNARKIVNGMRMKTYNKGRPDEYSKLDPADGEFSPEFKRQPIVRQSIDEGWDADLRMHCLRLVRRRLMAGASCADPGDMMPNEKWIEAAREKAVRFRRAAEWREGMLAEHGSLDNFLHKNSRHFK